MLQKRSIPFTTTFITKRISYTVTVFAFLWVMVNLLLAGCTRKVEESPADKPFALTDSQYRKLDIITADAVEVQNRLQLNGKVAFNDDNVIRVYPLVSGLVTSVKVQLGDYVNAGQVLAVIKSSEFAQYSSDYVNAQNNLKVAKKNLDATQDLYTSGLASSRDLLSAQSSYDQADAELKRVKRVLNINDANGSSEEYYVKSPISGFVVEKFITENVKIRPDNGNTLFTISDLKNVWVIGNAYESDISKIKLGDKAFITTLSYPGKTFEGNVDKIFNALDPVNKVMRVRVQLSNPEYLLKPEMYTSVVLQSDNQTTMLPVIPTKAIIFDNSKNYVLVIKDKSTISVREVRLGQTVGDKTYIQSGINAGEKIIAGNQLYLYQALNMNGR